MTIEELNYPRFTVISDYPFNIHFKVGEIITLNEVDKREHLKDKNIPYVIKTCFQKQTAFYQDELQKFPHIFHQLKWFEEREIHELPDYVKIKGQSPPTLKGIWA